MKLIVQIPCFNEEQTLPETLADIPRQIQGIDSVEIQVIDDGSTDNTLKVAEQLGVEHIISFPHNRGLSAAFKAGLENALKQKADILVNTDADNQYCGADIPKLVQPVLDKSCDITIGCRPIEKHPDFSWIKKKLQRLGTWVTNKVSTLDVRDATSGFRCYNRMEMMHLNLFSSFSYTLETLIQAGNRGARICSIPINVNPKTRRSRLYKNMPHYIWKSGITILRSLLVYRSRLAFGTLAFLTGALGLILIGRYYFFVFIEKLYVSDFWPSILAAVALIILSIIFLVTGTIASLISTNRKISEEILFKIRIINFDRNDSASSLNETQDS